MSNYVRHSLTRCIRGWGRGRSARYRSGKANLPLDDCVRLYPWVQFAPIRNAGL